MDNILFEKSLEESKSESSPFQRRDVVKMKDMNTAGNYSSNTSLFETVTLSNGGRWCDYTKAYITLPTVVVISAPGVDWTDDHLKETDHLLALKNSHLNLINSCQIDYGNQKTVPATDHINDYLIFKQHTEMSDQDQKLHGPTIGYNKNTAKSWYYHDVNGVSNNHCTPLALSATRLTESNEGFFIVAKILTHLMITYERYNQFREILSVLTLNSQIGLISLMHSTIRLFTTMLLLD